MKNSLKYLPQSKQNELAKIVLMIRKNCTEIEKIILFGSYARGTFKEAKDLKPQAKSGHVSDYDILVVTKNKDVALNPLLWSKISDELQTLDLSAYPKIITHDITELNKKLSEGQYFFSDISKEGILLFDSGNFELMEEKKLSEKEKQKIAQGHFNYWFKRAEIFFGNFESDFEKSRKDSAYSGVAAFHLHQVTESCYKGTLLVLTNYTPREHFLEILGKETEKHSLELKNIFPKSTETDETRFKLLEYAYIGGRYDPEYRISKEDLEILAGDVKRLLALSKRVCQQKIESFK